MNLKMEMEIKSSTLSDRDGAGELAMLAIGVILADCEQVILSPALHCYRLAADGMMEKGQDVEDDGGDVRPSPGGSLDLYCLVSSCCLSFSTLHPRAAKRSWEVVAAEEHLVSCV